MHVLHGTLGDSPLGLTYFPPTWSFIVDGEPERARLQFFAG